MLLQIALLNLLDNRITNQDKYVYYNLENSKVHPINANYSTVLNIQSHINTCDLVSKGYGVSLFTLSKSKGKSIQRVHKIREQSFAMLEDRLNL